MRTLLLLLAAAGGAYGAAPVPPGCRWGHKAPCPHPAQPVPQGPYQTDMDLIKEVPGVTSATTADQRGAIITFPTAGPTKGGYPVIVFGHGAMVGGHEAIGDGYHSLLLTVASYGFIVVSPLGCVMGDFTHDMLATYDACKNDPTLHASLAGADFSKSGFFGHSNGGCATQELAGTPATVKKYRIKAAVAEHCGCPSQTGACRDYGPTGSNVPFMYATASGDTIAPPAGSTNGYDLAGGGTKIVWIAKGGSHFEPADRTIPENPTCTGGANREDNPLALFFACHVRGEHCDEVYGPGGDAICRNNGTVMSTCKVSRGGGPVPPAPPPTPPSQLYTCQHNVCVAAATGISKPGCEAACGN